MKDIWGHEQCDEAFAEATRLLKQWQDAPKRNKVKLWKAFLLADERSKMMRSSVLEWERA